MIDINTIVKGYFIDKKVFIIFVNQNNPCYFFKFYYFHPANLVNSSMFILKMFRNSS